MAYKTIKEFKQSFNFVEYIAATHNPEKRGGNLFILCPFHTEKTPSCKVSPTGFYCFGCGAHGDCITFLMETLGLSIPDILKSDNLEEYIVTTVEDNSQQRSRQKYRFPSPSLVLAYNKQLMKRPRKKTYLIDRGVGDCTIRKALLGYGKPLDFSHFTRPRYTIPVFNEDGKLLSIRYRIDPAYDDKSEPKYLAHPNTPTTLYNLSALKRYDHILYVGSELDAAALYFEHDINAISPPGECVFKPQWANYFANKYVLIWLDNDPAGKSGALNVYNHISALAKKVMIYTWDSTDLKMDIGDYLGLYGPDAIKDELKTLGVYAYR